MEQDRKVKDVTAAGLLGVNSKVGIGRQYLVLHVRAYRTQQAIILCLWYRIYTSLDAFIVARETLCIHFHYQAETMNSIAYLHYMQLQLSLSLSLSLSLPPSLSYAYVCNPQTFPTDHPSIDVCILHR